MNWARKPFRILILALVGCVSSQKINVTKSRLPELTRVRSVATLLVSLRPLEDNTTVKALKELGIRRDETAAEQAQAQTEVMLDGKFSQEDAEHLQDLGILFLSFYANSVGAQDIAQKLARYVMFEKKAPVLTYQWALSSYAIAEITRSHEAFDLNALQEMECDELCDSPGWERLAAEKNAFSEDWYQRYIYGKAQFLAADVDRPPWLREHTQTKSSPQEHEENKLSDAERLRFLVRQNRFHDAAKIAKAYVDLDLPTGACPGEVIFAQYVYATLKHRAQDRPAFLKYQDRLVKFLRAPACHAENLFMDASEFLEFRADAEVWLGRLLWENGRVKEAFSVTKNALHIAETAGLWDLYFEATQVLVGRVGFETLPAIDNLRLLDQLERGYKKKDSSDFENWVQLKRGLLLYSGARFSEAAATFTNLENEKNDTAIRAAAAYWKGRSLIAAHRNKDASIAFEATGKIDPLSIYDIFAGQFVDKPSGRISSDEKTPFTSPWYEERDKWISLRSSRHQALFAGWLRPADTDTEDSERSEFRSSIRSSLLLVSYLRALDAQVDFEEFSGKLRDLNSVDAQFLRAQSSWLKQRFVEKYSDNKETEKFGDQIAWLLYVTGDYINSILFVGHIRGNFQFSSTPSSFLYFIFYPRPYFKEFMNASQKCDVDIDILYAISRQESLYQKDVVSGAGAVGLMQLMPSTAKRVLQKKFPTYTKSKKIQLTDPETNLLAGACYFKDLLDRYQGNMTFAIAAYNAGESAVDSWAKNRNRLRDVPFFTEFIPYGETQKYTQRVLRNYYNIKWIYSVPNKVSADK